MTTKIPVRQDTPAIEKFKADLSGAVTLLNQINQAYAIEDVSQIPIDVSKFIFGKALEQDPLLKQMHERAPLTLDSINLPAGLRTLSGLIQQWHTAPREGLHLIHRNDDGFYVDENELEAYADRWKTFITEPEQLERLQLAQDYVSIIDKVVSDPLQKIRFFKSPLTTWGRAQDEKSLFAEISLPFVTSGRLNT